MRSSSRLHRLLPITGELKVGDRTVEASDYVAELKQEAARLKNELATYAQSSGQNSLAAIGQYIASIDPEQRDLLVSKMTPEAREAAAELVNYVLKDSSPEGAGQKLEPDQQGHHGKEDLRSDLPVADRRRVSAAGARGVGRGAAAARLRVVPRPSFF